MKKPSNARPRQKYDFMTVKVFRILSERYRNRCRRFGLLFNLTAAIYNHELVVWCTPSAVRPSHHHAELAAEFSQREKAIRDPTSLILVDEAERLKMVSLEAMRDIFDRGGIGLILIGLILIGLILIGLILIGLILIGLILIGLILIGLILIGLILIGLILIRDARHREAPGPLPTTLLAERFRP